MHSRRLRVAIGLLLACGICTCSDAPTSGRNAGLARLALAVAFPNQAQAVGAAADLLVDNVHIVVSHSDETVATELDAPFPASQSEIAIQIEVALNSPQETLNVQVQLRTGALPLYTGAQDVAARRGGTTSPLTVPVSYVGPAAITILAGEAQTALLGTALPIPPSVKVTGAGGSPIPGVAVTFAVTGGGGSLTGATQTTNANGLATVGSWTLGALTAEQTLTATVGTLTTTFHATSLATLTISGIGIGTGTVVSTPAGLDCSITSAALKGACTGTFGASTVVTLNATPNAISNLLAWTGGCTGTSACQVTMDQMRTVGVNFGLLPYTLTIVGAGGGTGLVTASNVSPVISCAITNGLAGQGCSATYPGGTIVTLSAAIEALSGNVFSGWSGACTGTSSCVIPGTTGNVTVSASFGFDPCLHELSIAVGQTLSGDISTTDCQFSPANQKGQFADFYNFSLPSQQLLTATLDARFQPELISVLQGTNWFAVAPAGATTAAQTLALPPGTYKLAAMNAKPDTLGAYSITLGTVQSLSGCLDTRTVFGIRDVPATLGASDCTYTNSAGVTTVADGFSIFVPAGKRLNVTVATTSPFLPLIEFWTTSADGVLGSLLLRSPDVGNVGSASLSMVGPAGGQLVKIWVSSLTSNPLTGALVGGPYTITIDP